MQVFDAAQTARLLPYGAMVEALDHAFRTGVETPERVHHGIAREGEPDATLILMPAWRSGEAIGVKLVNVVPGNGARGLPSISGIYVLFDGVTGRPHTLLDGTELTARRTGAVSALASRYLSRPDARVHLVLGAGALAPHLARAHRAVRPIEETIVWARRPEEAERVAALLRDDGLDVRVARDLPTEATRADIVSCATLASEPILHGAWLGEGVHVDLVGSYRPHMREADDATLVGAAIYVDKVHGALHDSGELRLPIEAGVIGRDAIVGDLADLCSGVCPGRQSDAQKTLFKSVGTAQSDFAVAVAALEATKTG